MPVFKIQKGSENVEKNSHVIPDKAYNLEGTNCAGYSK